MNKFKKFSKQLYQSIEIVELILILLSSGIGLALIHFASYPIKWNESLIFILWVIFFFLGSGFLNDILKQNSSGNKFSFDPTFSNLHQLITILFYSFSIVPLVKIIIFSADNFLVIYLISTLGFWFLIKKSNLNIFNYFGIKETISSCITSFIAPLIILNINGIQIYKIIFPISFFVFLEIVAFQFIGELVDIAKMPLERTGQYTYIGNYSLIKTITILIPFGYISSFFLLLIQGNAQLFRPLLITIPLAGFILIKINRDHDFQNGFPRDIKLLATIFVILVEASWILGLYFGR
jgi:hypothetical protein